MWRKSLTHWLGLILIGALLSAPGGAFHRASASPQDILYTQNDQPGGNSVRSTNGLLDVQDNQLGDDFTLNCSGSCTINSFFLSGDYQGSGVSPTDLLVEIYADADAGVPGALWHSRTVLPANFVDSGGDFMINMVPPLVLGGGIWWVSVQATMNSFSVTWTWDDHLAAAPSVYPSVYRGAVGGIASQCTSWQPRVAICKQPNATAAPDLMFEVEGIGTGDNLAPYILRLAPAFVPPGSGDVAPLKIRGHSFVATSEVRWDGAPVPTTFISNSELQITVPAAWLVARDLIEVTVFNPPVGGGTSNPRYFLVGEPVFLPVIRR